MNSKPHLHLVAYYICIILIGFGTLFPQIRIWGFSNWAFYPTLVQVLVFFIALLLPLADRLAAFNKARLPFTPHLFGRLGLAYALGLTALFYLLRGRVHFLGDGDLRIDMLPQIVPQLRVSDYGVTLLAQQVYRLFEGSATNAAELAYQVMAYIGGIVFVLMAVYFSIRLYDDFRRRALFTLILTTAGYMLLFFGYVENYAFFAVFVALSALTGLEICRGRLHPLLIIPPVVAAVFLHLLGLALIPAAVFAIIANMKQLEFVKKANTAIKAAIILVPAALAVIAFAHFYNQSLFLRFATVPFFQNQFTVAGYTMFSISHLLDYANLIFLVFPGIIIALLFVLFSGKGDLLKQAGVWYLSILAACCLGAGFLLYPQLGMPRDWDLYAFAGIPLAVLGSYLLLSDKAEGIRHRLIPVLVIAVNLMLLVPRVVTQTSPGIAAEQVKSYAMLDPHKYIYVHKLLVEDYVRRGQDDKLDELDRLLSQLSPEEDLLRQGEELMDKREIDRAILLLKSALGHNRMLARAYMNLGSCYLMTGELDSAWSYLEYANAWNPHNPRTLNELGFAQAGLGQFEQAEKTWQQLSQIKAYRLAASLNILDLYSFTGQYDLKIALLDELEMPLQAPGDLLKQLGDHYFSVGDHNMALTAYRQGILNGLDSASEQEIYSLFPALRPGQ